MNLQSIERLQRLLERVEQNAKLPRTRTQGIGAFLAFRGGASTDVVPTEVAAARGRGISEVAARVPEVKAPAPTTVSRSVVAAQPAASVREPSVPPESLSPEELDAEELPIEDVSAEELGAEEIPIEIASEVVLEAPIAPQPSQSPAVGVASIVPKTYTAPPSLDELTFSEPPPPILAKPAAPAPSTEPPPASAAKLVSEAPGSIDAAILAATEAQCVASDAEEAEPPPVTPPPESGPQVALPPMAAPGVPAAGAPRRGGAPTIEQLGEVVELEPPSVLPLELAERRAKAAHKAEAPVPSEELEFVPQASEPSRKLDVREPLQTLVGGFTEEGGTGGAIVGAEQLAAAGRAAALIVPTAAAHPKPAVVEGPSFGEEAPTASSPTSALEPEAVARPKSASQASIVDVVTAARGYRPRSFVDLLDASIGLLK